MLFNRIKFANHLRKAKETGMLVQSKALRNYLKRMCRTPLTTLKYQYSIYDRIR